MCVCEGGGGHFIMFSLPNRVRRHGYLQPPKTGGGSGKYFGKKLSGFENLDLNRNTLEGGITSSGGGLAKSL